jgi:hypothetical protein
MPKLERSQWDVCRDMNWNFKYVTEAEVGVGLTPEQISIQQRSED